MISRFARAAAVGAITAAALVLAACGNSEHASPGHAMAGQKIRVVATTNVWGSVAQAVGADAVEVKALISDPGGDPHSYESTPADAAAVREADLVVYNGGGYDEFIDKILGSDNAGKRKVEAFALHSEDGHADEPSGSPAPSTKADEPGHAHGAVNEHVWYDLHVVRKVADKIAVELGAIKADKMTTFSDSAKRFGDKVGELETTVHEIGEAHKGFKVLATEPIADHLVAAAEWDNITPDAFEQAIEEETDPPAAAVAEIEQLIGDKKASVLIYNPQTESGVTKQVKAKAEAVRLPVVEMTETLPQGKDYVSWMSEQIAQLASTLKQ